MDSTAGISTPAGGGKRTAARTAVVGVLAAGLLLGGGSVAANAAVPAGPTAALTVPLDSTGFSGPDRDGRFFGRPGAGLALRFFVNGDSSNPDYGQRAAKVAGFILDLRPKLADRLPAALKADLTALRDAADGGQLAAAAKIKESALSGGYGEKIQKAAQRMQERKSARRPD
ncbi:hypothetical protein [Arthrobacter sp. CJ23]|uniref:hypothetical protein n=1 Tax=Arthrobacter sp. CJ23 TaxID=2972479 RepID=UPI00215C0860|nr:hypothetical protein [Arthrobacter sp. CJ23]UVJ39864.1 hypothetical protein NVV90_01315 [Arthrobacter sp. CJ23]